MLIKRESLEKSLGEMHREYGQMSDQIQTANENLERSKSANRDLIEQNRLLKKELKNLSEQVNVMEDEKVTLNSKISH